MHQAPARGSNRAKTAFTLIELMVVIAIIALLVAILLPSLQSARRHAKAVVCSTNLHHVGLAIADYLYVSKGTYPPSYVYPYDEDGNWTPRDQTDGKPFGYMHWSYFLYNSGEVDDKAFQCPEYEKGGAPRTNPGLQPENWESQQVDDSGNSAANDVEDKQAPRIAYGANAVVMPRNKFTPELSGGPRINMFVREQQLRQPGATIGVAEFLNNWKALGIQSAGGILSKSHRPINPFYHVGYGLDEYKSPTNTPGFIYGIPNDQERYGLLPLTEVREKANILDHSSGIPQINAVGRHHPHANKAYVKRYGGAANFLFADTHVESMTALDSVDRRQWGTHYYSISGENEVMNMSRVTANGN